MKLNETFLARSFRHPANAGTFAVNESLAAAGERIIAGGQITADQNGERAERETQIF
jgi:hypothetical protein